MTRRPREAASVAVLLALAAGACQRTPPPREYPVVGQIIRIDRATNHVTIRHEDIKGFMPGMTMPFPVKDAALLDGREPGDLIEATLLVQDTRRCRRPASCRRPGSPPAPECPIRRSPIRTERRWASTGWTVTSRS
jgi:Cu/Ag efflux protein CusF